MSTSKPDDSKKYPLEVIWMEKLNKAMKEKKPKLAVFETCCALLKTTMEEVSKLKREFKEFATARLRDSTIEESLEDYRECIIPFNQNPTFENYMKNTVEYCYQKTLAWTGWYHYALHEVMENGCLYKPDLKKKVEGVYILTSVITHVIFAVTKFMKYKPVPPVEKLDFPSYLTKNPSNTILFFRDFLIVRDYYDLLMRLNMTFVCRKRHFDMLTKDMD